MKKYLLILSVLAVAIGCQKDNLNPANPEFRAIYSVEAEPYENENGIEEVKSNYDGSNLHVTDVNIWVYNHSTGALVNNASGYSTYFSSSSDIDGDKLFPDMNTTYDIYMFTNVGQLTPPANKSAADSFRYTFSSYDIFKTKGFPMSAHECFKPSEHATNLKVKRLVSHYTVQFKVAASAGYSFTLKSAQVRNSALAISPYASSSQAANESEIMRYGDNLVTSEITSKGGDLYLLENVFENAFSSSTDRTYSTLAQNYQKTASYLEFVGEVSYPNGSGFKELTCRYYFGKIRNAEVKRNTNTPLTLTLTQNLLNKDEWQVVADDPYNDGTVTFSSNDLFIEVDTWPGGHYERTYETFSTITKVKGTVNNNVQYTLDYKANSYWKYKMRLEYKQVSGSWKEYSGETLTGACDFRVSSETKKPGGITIYAKVNKMGSSYINIWANRIQKDGLYLFCNDELDGVSENLVGFPTTSYLYELEPGQMTGNSTGNHMILNHSILPIGRDFESYLGNEAGITVFYARTPSDITYKSNTSANTNYAYDDGRPPHSQDDPESSYWIGELEDFFYPEANYNLQEYPYLGIKVNINNETYWVELDGSARYRITTEYGGVTETHYSYGLYLLKANSNKDCYFINLYNNETVTEATLASSTPPTPQYPSGLYYRARDAYGDSEWNYTEPCGYYNKDYPTSTWDYSREVMYKYRLVQDENPGGTAYPKIVSDCTLELKYYNGTSNIPESVSYSVSNPTWTMVDHYPNIYHTSKNPGMLQGYVIITITSPAAIRGTKLYGYIEERDNYGGYLDF